jgi:hypothetical protein
MFRKRSSAATSEKLMRSVGSQAHRLGRNAAVESYLSRGDSNFLNFARILKAPIHCIIP